MAVETLDTNGGVKPHTLSKKLKAIQQADHKKFDPKIDALLLAFLYIYEAVQIHRDTAAIQAKEIKANVVDQNNLIKEEALLHFDTLLTNEMLFKWGKRKHRKKGQSKFTWLPKTDDNKILENFNAFNQKIAAQRNIFGDKLTVLKQNVQVEETQINTDVNEDQESISKGSSLLRMLVSLTNQISRI